MKSRLAYVITVATMLHPGIGGLRLLPATGDFSFAAPETTALKTLAQVLEPMASSHADGGTVAFSLAITRLWRPQSQLNCCRETRRDL
ncbi:hypothetical protein [Herbidospora cretacea]|uniref:hypothetical protein n=1 Tax=Herbidospora cretacea TaxID=28444 RepID=UPI0004C2CBF2|nr:hypothetical protein [Herbidospora cretacea]